MFALILQHIGGTWAHIGGFWSASQTPLPFQEEGFSHSFFITGELRCNPDAKRHMLHPARKAAPEGVGG